MWGTGFGIGLLLALVFWAFVILPGDREYHRKHLEIVRNKLKRIEEKKHKEKIAAIEQDDTNEEK